jgi:hypothetical protein
MGGSVSRDELDLPERAAVLAEIVMPGACGRKGSKWACQGAGRNEAALSREADEGSGAFSVVVLGAQADRGGDPHERLEQDPRRSGRVRGLCVGPKSKRRSVARPRARGLAEATRRSVSSSATRGRLGPFPGARTSRARRQGTLKTGGLPPIQGKPADTRARQDPFLLPRAGGRAQIQAPRRPGSARR